MNTTSSTYTVDNEREKGTNKSYKRLLTFVVECTSLFSFLQYKTNITDKIKTQHSKMII